MSAKARLKAVEKLIGPNEPEVLIHRMYYERKEGGSDFGSASAHVNIGARFGALYVRSRDGETYEDFYSRLRTEVHEATGVWISEDPNSDEWERN